MSTLKRKTIIATDITNGGRVSLSVPFDFGIDRCDTEVGTGVWYCSHYVGKKWIIFSMHSQWEGGPGSYFEAYNVIDLSKSEIIELCNRFDRAKESYPDILQLILDQSAEEA